MNRHLVYNSPASSLTRIVTLAVLPLLFISGCKKTVDDATLTTNVKAALAADTAIAQQPIQATVQAGVVTLTGNVSDDTARSVAAQDAIAVTGVKQVVNNTTVAGISVVPTVTVATAPKAPRPVTREERKQIATSGTLPPPPVDAPPPPAPVIRNVTLDAGRDIPIRITETLDSETTETGQPFTGVVTREIDADGFAVIPAGAAVRGRVVEAKDATHFKGSSLLSIELTSIRRHGESIEVATDPYSIEGKGRGKNTAEKVGGGAAIGAIVGGIFGGGKGAAIGAAAGGGGGAVVQGVTRGQQVRIPSETVIRFRLARPITIQTSEAAGPEEEPGLQTR
ncbi:MAG: BON domain-containing protein [Acidobacteriota bacterium]